MPARPNRPYFNLTGRELVEVFQSCNSDLRILKNLSAELVHRNQLSRRIRDLRAKVAKALAEARPAARTPQEPAQLPLLDPGDTSGQLPPVAEPPDRPPDEDEDHPIGPIRGRIGSIRPCGVIAGVPSRWLLPDRRDFELDVGRNATRIEKFVAALRALVNDMRRRGSGMRTVTFEHGETVALDGRERGYRFPYDGDAELFEGAKVTISIGKRTCAGRIVSVSSLWLTVSFDEDLGATIGTCVLRIDNTAMIDALADRLDKVRSGEAKLNLPLADDVLDNRDDQVPPTVIKTWPKSEHELNPRQKEFVGHAIANAVTYLWGPPGTGKTHSLSTINERLFDAGKRILICSNTNAAVDQVLLKLCETLTTTTTHPALDDGRVLRIGKTGETLANFREYVTLDGIVGRKSKDLQKRKAVLEGEIQPIRSASESARRILDAFQKLDEAQREREDVANHRAALIKSISDAVAVEQEVSRSMAKLETALEKRRIAGVIRRLLTRSESAIRAALSRAQARKDSAAERLQKHRLALDDPERQEREREVATRHEKLVAALRDQNRVAAQKLADEEEEKVAPALREVAQINKALESIEKAVVADARIIGATVTKTYLTPEQFRNFDVVIVDEASMVMLPAIYYVSGLAKEKVIVSGDFCQLSPIVTTQQTAIQEVIGPDVFQSAGITEAVKAQRQLKRTVMLTHQYRMNHSICDLISARLYKNSLVTKVQRKAYPPPSPFDSAMTVIDTSPIQPFVNRHGSSRYNLMNALAVRNLVRHFQEIGFLGAGAGGGIDQRRLGICTPFAAQRDLLKRLTKATGVTVGTVHRYQGDQKLAMVIDIPDSLGERYVSLFAQGGSFEDVGTKLFNVAVSRAQEHIIFVANLDYLDAKLPEDAFLRDLLHTASHKGRVVDVRDVLAMWPIAEDLKPLGRPFSLDQDTLRSGLFRQSDFEAVCGADIEQAKKSVVIYSGFVTPQRVAAYESLFRRKLAEGIKIRCVTRPPRRNGSIPEDLGRDALNGLEAMGCVVDTRWDIHEKVVIVDDEIMWFGSLNPLSHTNRTDEMMARITGKPAALQLSAFMAVASSINPDKAEGLSVVGENPRCPACGHRATYRLGPYGPFWQCEDECGWKQNVGRMNRLTTPAAGAETLPKEGALCPICSAKTVLRHGPHGHFYGCSKYPECKGIAKESGRPNGKSKWRQKARAKRGR